MANFNREYKEARLHSFAGTALDTRGYNLTIGLTLLWGVAINIIMATVFQSAILRMNYLAVILIYFVGSIGCSIAVYRSRTPAGSLLGFSGLAASMGLLLTYYVYFFAAETVAYAFAATGLVTVIMVILSTLYPNFFLGLGRVLGVSLLGALLIELIGGLIFRLPLTMMDYVIVLIFCGYIGFDWSRAQRYPRTTNNAIACAADIYVDVVNIFVRILEIAGRNNRR